MISKRTMFKNDEETIRDGFMCYLKDDIYKNAHSPLDKYQFDKEVEDGKGRLDIRILNVNPYKGDKAFYSIECKRLDNNYKNGISGLNFKYIKDGMCRYISGYYSTYYDTNVMFGFVVEQMDITKNIDNINALLPVSFFNQQNELVNANTVQPLQYFDFANGYPFSYMSKHTHKSGKEITLYHLMFDFSNSIQ